MKQRKKKDAAAGKATGAAPGAAAPPAAGPPQEAEKVKNFMTESWADDMPDGIEDEQKDLPTDPGGNGKSKIYKPPKRRSSPPPAGAPKPAFDGGRDESTWHLTDSKPPFADSYSNPEDDEAQRQPAQNEAAQPGEEPAYSQENSYPYYYPGPGLPEAGPSPYDMPPAGYGHMYPTYPMHYHHPVFGPPPYSMFYPPSGYPGFPHPPPPGADPRSAPSNAMVGGIPPHEARGDGMHGMPGGQPVQPPPPPQRGGQGNGVAFVRVGGGPRFTEPGLPPPPPPPPQAAEAPRTSLPISRFVNVADSHLPAPDRNPSHAPTSPTGPSSAPPPPGPRYQSPPTHDGGKGRPPVDPRAMPGYHPQYDYPMQSGYPPHPSMLPPGARGYNVPPQPIQPVPEDHAKLGHDMLGAGNAAQPMNTPGINPSGPTNGIPLQGPYGSMPGPNPPAYGSFNGYNAAPPPPPPPPPPQASPPAFGRGEAKPNANGAQPAAAAAAPAAAALGDDSGKKLFRARSKQDTRPPPVHLKTPEQAQMEAQQQQQQQLQQPPAAADKANGLPPSYDGAAGAAPTPVNTGVSKRAHKRQQNNAAKNSINNNSGAAAVSADPQKGPGKGSAPGEAAAAPAGKKSGKPKKESAGNPSANGSVDPKAAADDKARGQQANQPSPGPKDAAGPPAAGGPQATLDIPTATVSTAASATPLPHPGSPQVPSLADGLSPADQNRGRGRGKGKNPFNSSQRGNRGRW
ncbi:hypothetical protein DIPPA_33194 [Diplonema papillatum]|nr:hypothetical protein DIPPA_33194 [Diplonema papillatum]